MIKNNPRIKNNITIVDEISVIKTVVDSYFTNNEYTPYYAERAMVIGIALNFLEGIQFEDGDSIYDLIISNNDLYSLIKKFTTPSVSNIGKECSAIFDRVVNMVDDIVDFRKQKLIHQNSIEGTIENFFKDLNKAMSNFANMNVSALTPENIELAVSFMKQLKDKEITNDVLVNVIREASDFKVPENDIINGQRQEIKNQRKRLQDQDKKIKNFEKFMSEHMARNVKADK